MPQSNHSSKRVPRGATKTTHATTPEFHTMRHLDMSSKAANQARRPANVRPGGKKSFDRKRRASSSSVSSVSSVSSLEEMSEEADDSDDDADDEEDRPLAKAPSYGRRRDNARKAGRQPAKSKRRRISDEEFGGRLSSDANESDDSSDDVYAAVDYITDADDEEQDVEKLEEMMIMQSEREYRVPPNSDHVENQWDGSEMFGDSMLLPAASFFDEEQLYRAMDTFGETDMASEAVETPVARRVHFEEQSESSSDSDSHTDDEIPSDFLQQDSLDPQLRRMIENDNNGNNHRRSHRRQSEELFGDADYGHSNIYHAESDGTSEGSLSGYESTLAARFSLFAPLLTRLQPMMAILLMKIFPRRPPSHTLARFFVAPPRTRWLLQPMTSLKISPADEARSWAPSWLTPTSPWPWSTAQASTSLSFRPMPPLGMIG